MSRFMKVNVTYKDRSALAEALKVIFGESAVSVSDTPTHLIGYKGDTREEAAEIVVSRHYISSVSNDAGWALNSEGSYELIISEYDRSALHSYKLIDRVTQEYARIMVTRRLQSAGYEPVVEVNPAGGYNITAKKRSTVSLGGAAW